MNLPPVTRPISERVAMAARCRDCDDVPKVADAGKVVTDAADTHIQIMHNGLRVHAGGYYGDWMTDLIRQCRGHHEPQEERVFHEVLKHLGRRARMVELGGFWAYYSLWFLLGHPERQALVLEPETEFLEVGRRNARLNRLSPEFVNGFIGATQSPAETFHSETGRALEMPRFSVGSLMDRQGWDRLDLLHCDVQGAEVGVLEGCRDLLADGRIDWLFVSTHSHHISNDPLTHFRCLEILRQTGAVIEVEHDVHESFSGDGLIVARTGVAPTGWRPPSISHNRHGESLFRPLAFDVFESWLHRMEHENRLAAHAPEPSVTPGLTRRGQVFELQEDGALGCAGQRLLLPDDAVMSPTVKTQLSWELEGVLEVAKRLTSDLPLTLIDIGANIGLFTLQLSRTVPSIERIICVEPDAGNFGALGYNLGHLRDRVDLFNHALGDRDGVLQFFRDDENIGNYSLNPDAMRHRAHQTIEVEVRDAANWFGSVLTGDERIVWKSDTQGFDDVIVSVTPMDVWRQIVVAQIELWRIRKTAYDRAAFEARIADFPNRKLGSKQGVSVDEVIAYLDNDDWSFDDLVMWR